MVKYSFFAGETKSINFRETVGEHQRADDMKQFQHLMYDWKRRGKHLTLTKTEIKLHRIKAQKRD